MGKKAKLKKARRDNSNPPTPTAKPTEFVNEMQKHGYRLNRIEITSPQLPENRPQPEI